MILICCDFTTTLKPVVQPVNQDSEKRSRNGCLLFLQTGILNTCSSWGMHYTKLSLTNVATCNMVFSEDCKESNIWPNWPTDSAYNTILPLVI